MATVGSIPDPAQAGDTMPAQKARERWECRLIFGVMLPDIEKIDPR